MEESCRACNHCAPRHMKENLNTSGNYVCLVLGSLIPDSETEKMMCSGLYYDLKETKPRDEWISVAEAAEILGVHRNRVLQLVNEGALDAHKVGQRWNISKASVESRAANPPKAGRRW